ncbi:MAG TPA: dihydrodipicolinate synthase family protein [Steroidobacteraceae bacterium]|nr:dihydrodipicolinate synthase family protein [Steroidobacteraceae bacterium]
MQVNWKGVYPAVTTQLQANLAIDIAGTQRVVDALIRDGVDGLIALGTVGENNSLEPAEKATLLQAIVETVAGRVPVIAGVSEYDQRRAARFAQQAEKLGANGLMVLPPMVYVPTTAELAAHFTGVARATSLPIMLYNNPPAYRTNIDVAVLGELATIDNIVAVKESAPDPRRFTDLRNAFGERFVLFAGLDDLALEALYLGARGWVSGLTNAFPRESVGMVAAFERGDHAKAREIYRWFMPLLHLDAEHDLVQSIKLAEQIMGRGSEFVLPPRLPLAGERRTQVIKMVENAAATRPELPRAKAA